MDRCNWVPTLQLVYVSLMVLERYWIGKVYLWTSIVHSKNVCIGKQSFQGFRFCAVSLCLSLRIMQSAGSPTITEQHSAFCQDFVPEISHEYSKSWVDLSHTHNFWYFHTYFNIIFTLIIFKVWSTHHTYT